MIQGDIATFLNALGSGEGEPALEDAVALGGGTYETESYDDEGEDTTYFLMSDRGLDLLLEGG